MNKGTATSSQHPSPHIDSLVFFVDAFYRMFKIGIYYPVGHVTLDQSASKCLQLLREISPNFTSIHIVVKKDTMYLMDQEVPGNHTGAEDLRKLMYEIGVQSIEIYRTVTHRDLLSCVKKILSWRSQLKANQGILDFDLGDLPQTIHLQQQEFVVDGSAKAISDTDETLYGDLDQISTALQKQGLRSGQVEQCRGLLEHISKNTAGKKINIAGFPNASWEDVQDLLFKIITSRYDAEEKGFSPHMHNDINVIASILQSFEHGQVDEKSKETLQLLVTHLTARKAEHTAEDAKGKPKQKERVRKRRSEVVDTVSTKVLETFIYKNAVPLEVLKKITGTDNSESLSILLQLLGGDLDDHFQELLESRVILILSGPLSSRELEVIIGGIKSFADKAETPTFHRQG